MYLVSPFFFPLDKKSGHTAEPTLTPIVTSDIKMKYLCAWADKPTRLQHESKKTHIHANHC